MSRTFLKSNLKFLKYFSIFLGIALLIFALFFNFSFTNKHTYIDYQRVVVREGDTLWSLVKKLSNEINTQIVVEETIKFNNLNNTYIQPGQVIYIPLDL
ncbi:MAG: LysM peptidoglycan-binding domain-containing protein [Peptococcaceae bacterium]|nr:LysM peptidoglycan-binding domain-containing protein [Peptococcaceae bacterium]